MRRREFISLLGGAAAWPLGARGEQSLPVVGFLSVRSPDESASLVAVFRRALADAGYVEGTTVAIQYRWANGDYDRLPALAAELVRIPVAVLVAAGGEPAARAAAVATKTIPVIGTFAADPVKNGIVSSLGRPGGNVTGLNNLSSAMEPKRVGLLREVAPQAKVFGALVDPDFAPARDQLRDIEVAANSSGFTLEIFRASTEPELDTAFDAITSRQVSALLIASAPFYTTRRSKIAAQAINCRLPTMYAFREYAEAGGLMTYGIDLRDDYRQLAAYAGLILKGTKPSDLPVVQPTNFVFVINMKTAKAIGAKISDNLLSLATEVIE